MLALAPISKVGIKKGSRQQAFSLLDFSIMKKEQKYLQESAIQVNQAGFDVKSA
jgi:hypothetical protein